MMEILSLHFFRFGFHLPPDFLYHVCGHTNARENGPVLEWSTLLDRSSCIFELSTSKYTIVLSMVFGCSDDMLELCPILSQTPVGVLCILHGQPKILEAKHCALISEKNMVSYHPPTHTYPKSPFLRDSEKGITNPYLRNNIFPEFSLHRNACAIYATCSATEQTVSDPGV